ncbi:S66 peptidase family protein [Amorphoplanes digitatis]|uniref:Muramoyltetrapeptide carboxypeptidase LdcA involved in peptidoglycan recycling n=1 Tax=Actinoplanes digitatis TaxID=1868 RepID=A0A7W7I5H3_9ACTN|nr:S66 peptidase family protein [Actinoplanes digitatis]MBB4766825.1 muramoyltetrapeptide carboxypeptidase LdcA involved in peptidoglycan recycling [Actinoplanes digitatis]GID96425.1 LD-carboxypeptidase [Actinoplanes digitatis]
MRPEFTDPPKLAAGDRIAVLSPAFAAPALFPELHEQSLLRLRRDFQLEPVEFPSTRRHSSARERAEDLMAAYADPSIRAVLATIGGDDQITVLRHLDPKPFLADPKPFFGFSDNTNVLNWLWSHGVAAYHGMSTMMHIARGAGVQPIAAESLRAALFTGGDVEIRAVERFSDEEIPWTDPASLTRSATPYDSPGRVWHQADRVVSAPTWGGCLEILHWTLAAGRWVRPVEDYAGCVLLLETSEEMPPADEVFRMLRNFGERGLLEQFPAILVGTAKGTVFNNPKPMAERVRYREEQRAAVLRALADYHPGAMVVFGVDFGHTDPQWVLPYGGRITVDGPARRITAHY